MKISGMIILLWKPGLSHFSKTFSVHVDYHKNIEKVSGVKSLIVYVLFQCQQDDKYFIFLKSFTLTWCRKRVSLKQKNHF